MAQNNFIDTLKGLGPARLGVMGIVIFMLLIFFVFVSFRVSEPSLSMLYSDLTSTDSAAVAAELEGNSIRYQVSADGTKVFVPESEIGRARMLLAEAGLPNGGSLGYEVFDKQSGFGSTTFMQNLNKKRALEGELSRTIMALDQVVGAKVHIVLPTRELFAREAREATASVTLKLNPAARLNQKQIYAIQNLVANAVPELRARAVTILDNEANLLAGGDRDDDGTAMGGVGSRADEMRRSFEARMTRSIEDLVGRVVGINQVRATVTADLDFDRVSTNAEIYDPEGQVTRSTQVIEESERETQAGNQAVTVDNNLPGLEGLDGGGSAGPASETSRIEELTNFEISKTIQSTVRESGEVQRLSVAVIVDGTYTTDAEGNRVYEPRSEQEMNQIRTLVRSAVGFDQSRGDSLEVVNLRFAEMDFEDPEAENMIFGFRRSELLETVQMLTLGIMLLLVILLVVKPILTQLFRSMQEVVEEDDDRVDPLLEAQSKAALAPPSQGGGDGEHYGDSELNFEGAGGQSQDGISIDMAAVQGKVKASTVKKVGEIVNSHPNETVSVIRQWMSSD